MLRLAAVWKETDVHYPSSLDPVLHHVCSKHAQHHAQAVAAYASLMQGLSGEPILILVGSDGGNAQSVAKKLAGEAKQRGLAPRYDMRANTWCAGWVDIKPGTLYASARIW